MVIDDQIVMSQITPMVSLNSVTLTLFYFGIIGSVNLSEVKLGECHLVKNLTVAQSL